MHLAVSVLKRAEPLVREISLVESVIHRTVRGVNYFCRLRTTISAGEGSANELAGDRSGAR